MAEKIGKITGPPGCGKTTELMRLITEACSRYFPHRIGAVSYTNTAVNEIKARIAASTGSDEGLIKNVRTMHSHCFQLLGAPELANTESRLAEFNEAHPDLKIQLRNEDPDENDSDKRVNAQQYYDLMQIYRNRLVPVEQWEKSTAEFYKSWSGWMREAGYTDFTGLLEETLAEGLTPDIDVLFCDEAQDLTPLQYALVDQWSDKTDTTIYSGDSDQCIFRWAGSIPESFIDLKHTWYKHLTQSYRVSPAVHKYANHILRKIDRRENVTYDPCLDYGPGKVYETDEPDLSLEGSHMILCRCMFQVDRWLAVLRSKGLWWHNPYRPEDHRWNPLRAQSWVAAKTYTRLMDMEEVPGPDFEIFIKKLIAKGNLNHGAKAQLLARGFRKPVDVNQLPELGFADTFPIDKPITDVLKLTGSLKPRIVEVHEAGGEDFEIKPSVIVGTIHSVKGGEADHVWLDRTLISKIVREVHMNAQARSDEARVFYVAATRARQTLGLLRPSLPNTNQLLHPPGVEK